MVVSGAVEDFHGFERKARGWPRGFARVSARRRRLRQAALKGTDCEEMALSLAASRGWGRGCEESDTERRGHARPLAASCGLRGRW